MYFSRDVVAAFLHAPVPVDRIMLLRPPTCEKVERYWRFEKALYGFRESPRWWQEHFSNVVKRHDWTRLHTEPMLYMHKS